MDIDAFAVPSGQAMNGEGMAQIVGPRSDPTVRAL
jgi:hypothetical protein